VNKLRHKIDRKQPKAKFTELGGSNSALEWYFDRPAIAAQSSFPEDARLASQGPDGE
jgi:hypothetical protein